MSWFSSSSSSTAEQTPSSSSTTSSNSATDPIPSSSSLSSASEASSNQQQQKQQNQLDWGDYSVRKNCFQARDFYYQCVKKDGPEECAAEHFRRYLESCPENWRGYWDAKYKEEVKTMVLEYDDRQTRPHGIDKRGPIASNPYA